MRGLVGSLLASAALAQVPARLPTWVCVHARPRARARAACFCSPPPSPPARAPRVFVFLYLLTLPRALNKQHESLYHHHAM